MDLYVTGELRIICAFHIAGGVNILYEDHLGVVDFHPSEGTGVIYVSEGDLVSGTLYRRKIAKLRMVSTQFASGIIHNYIQGSNLGTQGFTILVIIIILLICYSFIKCKLISLQNCC